MKYEGYILRQGEQVGRFRGLEERRIPSGFDWGTLQGVSTEAREKLRADPPDLRRAGVAHPGRTATRHRRAHGPPENEVLRE